MLKISKILSGGKVQVEAHLDKARVHPDPKIAVELFEDVPCQGQIESFRGKGLCGCGAAVVNFALRLGPIEPHIAIYGQIGVIFRV